MIPKNIRKTQICPSISQFSRDFGDKGFYKSQVF
jgi:hypothetical protein